MATRRGRKQVYEYRRLSDKEKREVVEERKRAGRPWHAPPHYSKGEAWYFVTAAIYEHRLIMESEDRRLKHPRAPQSTRPRVPARALDEVPTPGYGEGVG